MSEWVSLSVLAFAVSLDSFGVGVTYGFRKMRLPIISLLFVMSCSAIAVLLAMSIGGGIGTYLSPEVAERLGGIILIVIGMFALFQAYRKPNKYQKKGKQEATLVYLEIKRLGIVINVLKKPMKADLDESGSINGTEALLLGIALSLDAFGAGMGAALLGISPWFLAVSVAIMCGLFLSSGKFVGEHLFKSDKLKQLTFLPGILLMIIGIVQL